MRLNIVKRRTPSIARFNKKEWRNADTEHYGRPQDFSETQFRIVAREKNGIIGSLKLRIKLGVCEVQSIIVGKKLRGTGVGSALMEKAEQIARKRGIHKLWLETGKGWAAEKFYRKLGYRKNTVLPKHYAKRDFILYEKMLR